MNSQVVRKNNWLFGSEQYVTKNRKKITNTHILFLGLSSPSPRKKRKTCKSATPRKAALSGNAEVTSTLPKVRLTYGQATAADSGCSEREPKRSNVKDNDCSRSSAAATK